MENEYGQHIDKSYEGALVAAGAVVEASEFFGSYQGDAWFRVLYEGKRGWLRIGYGSCSGCDALEASFDYSFGDTHVYGNNGRVPKSEEVIADEKKLFAEFGAGYLDDELMTQEEAEKKAAENIEWDREAKDVLAFLKANTLLS